MILTDCDLMFMNVIKVIFSNIINLLCMWYIDMNVRKQIQQTSNLQKKFKFSLVYNYWKEILYINTLSKYEIKWTVFKYVYRNYKLLTDYIYWCWLKDYKKHFIQAYINHYCYYSNIIISQIKESYTGLKQTLISFTDDLYKTVIFIECTVQQKLLKNYNKIKTAKQMTLYNITNIMYKQIIAYTSLYAIKQIVLQKCRLHPQNQHLQQTCIKTFSHKMSLSCNHIIKEWMF